MRTRIKTAIAFAILLAVSFGAGKAMAAGKPAWRIGDSVVLQYSFDQIDEFALVNNDLRTEISNSVVNETHRRLEIQNDLNEKFQRFEKSAARIESRNPLLRRSAAKAQVNQALLSAAMKENQQALKTLSEIADFSRKKGRLTVKQRNKLGSYNFVEEIRLSGKSDFVKATSRITSLNDSKAVVSAADAVPAKGLMAKGFRIVRTKKGVMALGVLASVAMYGYDVYAASQADKAENDFHDVLVYDEKQ